MVSWLKMVLGGNHCVNPKVSPSALCPSPYESWYECGSLYVSSQLFSDICSWIMAPTLLD